VIFQLCCSRSPKFYWRLWQFGCIKCWVCSYTSFENKSK